MTAESTPPTPLPAAERWRPAWPLVFAVVLALAHFGWVGSHHAPAIMSPDSNGYVVQARLLANEARTSFAAESPVQFVGMHWLETGPGVFHSRYPAGLPLLFAAAWKLGGLEAALWLNPLLASATVLLVFLLARRFVSDGFALLAAGVVAVVPVFNQHALDADAHIAAGFLLVAGVFALMRFADLVAWRMSAGSSAVPSAGREVTCGMLAGFLLGMVPTVRYPEAVAGVAIAAWLGWRVRPVWRAWPAVAGAAVPLAALGAHNAAAYGAFWRTGYALTGEQTGFGLNYFTAHAIPYLQALGGQGLGLMFAFGAAGLAALCVDRERRAEGLMCVGIVGPLLLLYMAYYFGGAPGGVGGGAVAGNLRFLIPIFPFFAVAAAWLLEAIAVRLGAAGRAAVGVVAALQILIGVAGTAPTLAQAGSSLRAAARARQVAEKEIPAGSVVIVERTLAESLDATGEWKLVEEGLVAGMMLPGEFGPGAAGAGPGRGLRMMAPGSEDAGGRGGPSPQQPGKNRDRQERYRGLTASERRAKIWSDLETWAAGRPIFWFTRSLDAVEMALPRGADYRSIAELDAPMMVGPGMGMAPGPGPAMTGGRGGRGAFGPPGMRGPNFGPPAGRDGRGNVGGAAAAKLRVVRIDLPKT